MYKKKGIEIENGDIIVITEKIVSKSEGRLIKIDDIKPSKKALEIAKICKKDPRIIELILRESSEILFVTESFILVKTKHGFICANAGIDESNIEHGYVKLLPENPDESAKKIRKRIEELTGKKVGVLIIDSMGRPFRHGSVGTSIGSSGLRCLYDRRGHRDIYDKILRSTIVCISDNISGIPNLIFGEANERIPACIIRGLGEYLGEGSVKEILRKEETDLCLRLIKEYKKEKGLEYIIFRI